ncbi:Uncharacterized protein APZ42_002573 [Daphnia magna]|uniref:Uncharacterized protein n=1 Tax=Daphnia magna TaxID=35525 RepID=A0A164I6M9_9CRUS|nr:Uncharacterized protein APZ42_002573 [Daphnia magna]
MPRLFYNFNKVTQIQEPRVYRKDERKKKKNDTSHEERVWTKVLNVPRERRISMPKFIGYFDQASVTIRNIVLENSFVKILNFLLHRLHSFYVQSLRPGESRTQSGLHIMRPFPEGNCVPVA